MADNNQEGEAPTEETPPETVADVLQGDPKDPDSPLHGASFQSATEGEPSRALPKKKPAKDKPDEKDSDKPEGESEDKAKSKDDKGDKEEFKAERPDRDNIDKAEGAKEHMVMSSSDKDGDGKEDEGRKLAIFDFDGTLIEQDSLNLFICRLAGGKLAAYLRFLPAIFTAFLEAIFTTDDYMDYKSALKAHWMINTLKGLSPEQIDAAAKDVKRQVDWRDKLVADLKRFAEADDTDVVISTGAIDLFVKPLIDDLPINALICSHAEVKDGKLTGRMAGKRKENVNVVRGEKRFRTQAFIKERGPYVHVIGYGNMPDDGPMLSLCDEFYIV